MIKVKIKENATKDYMTTVTGYTITKDKFVEVDPNAIGMKYVINHRDVIIQDNESIKNVKKEVFMDKVESSIKDGVE